MATLDSDERQEELEALAAIFQELNFDPSDSWVASLDIEVAPSEPVTVVADDTPTSAINGEAPDVDLLRKRPQKLSYLPSVRIKITLPEKYPANEPPRFEISTTPAWIPSSTIQELEEKGRELWESYGHVTIAYDYISSIQEASQDVFGLGPTITIPRDMLTALVDYDRDAKRKVFERGTYDCGVCLDPKSGRDCFQLSCGDVFCRSCLQDFYTSAIKEGDVATVQCLAPDCKADVSSTVKRRQRTLRPLKPSELLRIPLEVDVVKRYVEIKRKKKIESDKNTIYCPREWCQGFVRSDKYPPINDLDDIIAYDNMDSDHEESESGDENQEKTTEDKAVSDRRLCICEKCKFAFCRTCLRGWHGSYVNCRPRDSSELTEEEKQSYEFIARNTSQCPSCAAPTQKTHGCNHMTCSVCRSHFCYLCQAYLDSSNPYQHFNVPGTPCYERLWEGEAGDEDLAQGNVHFEGARGWELAIAAAEEAEINEAA